MSPEAKAFYRGTWSPGLAGLEMVTGCANFSRAFRNGGLNMLDPVDVRHGPQHDVLVPRVMDWLLEQVRSGKVGWVYFSPPLAGP